jgi:hypothetical protein
MADLTIKSIISNLNKLLKINTTKTQKIPTPLILASSNRSGLSAIVSTQNVLKAKQQLGLPTGTLPNGNDNYDDIMIKIILEEIYRALREDTVISVAIEPGGQLTAAGTAGPIPCEVEGAITAIQSGNAIIQ